MRPLLAALLALTLAAPAAAYDHDDDEYTGTATVLIDDSDRWYTLRYRPVTLPTDEGACEAVFYFPLERIPGGPDGVVAPVVYPVPGSAPRSFTAFMMNFYARPYGPEGKVGFMMLIRTEGDCTTSPPIAYRVKARIRGRQ
jgi:hypothetical protein